MTKKQLNTITSCIGAMSLLVFSNCSDDLSHENIPGASDHLSSSHIALVGGIQPELNYICPNAFNTSSATFVDTLSVAAQETIPRGVTFSHDGTKAYVIGSVGDDINEYDVATPYDISTGVFVDTFSVAAQELNPSDLALSPDGTKLFVIGFSGDDVNEYDLTTPCDVSTGVFVDSFSISAQELVPTGLAFSTDGTKMFVMGINGDDVNEYNLGSAFDVSTSVFSQNFSVAAQELNPSGLTFNHDGTKMYVIGYSGDDINEYTLSTAWDVSTAFYVDAFLISAQESAPRSVEFNKDGTKVYVMGTTGDDINEYNILALNYPENATDDGSIDNSDPLQITLTGDTFQDIDNDNILDVGTEVNIGNIPAGLTPVVTLSNNDTTATLTLIGNATNNDDVDDVANLTFAFDDSAFSTLTSAAVANSGSGVPYDLKIGIDFFEELQCLTYIGPDSFDITKAVFTDTLSVSAQETNPEAMTFNNDGTELYVLGFTGDDINHYTLSTPWDVSTGVFDYSVSIFGQEATPAGLTFSPDGTKLYLIGWSGDDVNEYNVLVPWDVRTLEFVHSFSVGVQDTLPMDVDFNPDGTIMYVTGRTNDGVYEYNLGTAWDVSTATFVDSLSVLNEHPNATGAAFNNHGDKLYIIGLSVDSVSVYNLGTPWDVSTGVHSSTVSIVAQEATPGDVTFNIDGTRMYVIGRSGDDINEYAIELGDYIEDQTGGGLIDPATFLCVELGGDVFQDTDNDNILDVGSEVTIGNVPPGLTPVMTLTEGDTKVTLTFTGNATDHADTDDIASLTFSFDDSAFIGSSASDIKLSGDGVPYDSSVGIDFTDICGDGVILAPEVCDDGNDVPGDGCDSLCQVEAGWVCDGLNPTTCNTVCGDGILVTPIEQCDDGGNAPGDGCDAICIIEAGWTCDGLSPSTCNLGVTEFCSNGIDDDLDGLVDVWDTADCPCTPGGPINACPATCTYTPVAQPYDPQPVWNAQTVDARETPLVGDVDGDGVPEVVVDDYKNPGTIYILDGITGATEHTIPTGRNLAQNNSSNAIADVDRDGKAEIYFVDNNRNLNRLIYNNGLGTWIMDYTSPDLVDLDLFIPGLADFDGNGVAEVFLGNQIYDAATGALLLDAAVSDADPGGSVAIDILPDAFCANCAGLELVMNSSVWSVDLATSTITEEVALTSAGTGRGPTSVADVDNDGDYDIAYTASVGGLGSLVVWDGQTDTLLMPIYAAPPGSSGLTSGGSGRPNIADFDNDGFLEFGFVAREIYMVVDDVNAAGAPVALWTFLNSDRSARTGSTVFDFEADGAAEVVYRDETTLYVFEGATGNQLFSAPCTSLTRFEYPVVADVNNDGETEIVVTCDNVGVSTFKSANAPWAPSRSVWNQHAYNVTNILDNLFVPTIPPNNLTTLGGVFDNYLVQAPMVDAGGNAQFPVPDAEITSISGAFAGTCPGLEVTYTIENTGDSAIPANMPISLYDADPTTTMANLLTTIFLPANVAPGTSATFTQTVSIAGPLTIFAVLNDPGTLPTPFNPVTDFPITSTGECDFTNQVSMFSIILCPECGNSVIDVTGEVCDDGNLLPDDGCDGMCLVEAGWTCNGGSPTICKTTCGDGIVAGTEVCDDGNITPGDGCDAVCDVETGWTCDGADPTVCTAICGDGLILGAEVCDDGNSLPDDGCSDICQIEPGWKCDTSEPTVCKTICGDGITTPAEECDDNNTTNNDGCTNCIVDPTANCVETPPGGTSVCTFPPSLLRLSKLERDSKSSQVQIGLTASYDVSDVYIEWANDWTGPFTRHSKKPLPAIGLGTTYTEAAPVNARYGRVVEVNQSNTLRVVKAFELNTLPMAETSKNVGSIDVTRSYGLSYLKTKENTKSTLPKNYDSEAGLLVEYYSDSIHGVLYSELEETTKASESTWINDCQNGFIEVAKQQKSIPYYCDSEGLTFYPGKIEDVFDTKHFVSIKRRSEPGTLPIGTVHTRPSLAKRQPLFSNTITIEENLFPVTAAEPNPKDDLFYWEVLSNWSDTSRSMDIPLPSQSSITNIQIEGFAFGETTSIEIYDDEDKLGDASLMAGQSHNKSFNFEARDFSGSLTLKVTSGTLFLDAVTVTQNDVTIPLTGQAHSLSGGAYQSEFQALWSIDSNQVVKRLQRSDGNFDVLEDYNYIEEDITWSEIKTAQNDAFDNQPVDVLVFYPQDFQDQVDLYRDLYPAYTFELAPIEPLYNKYSDGQRDPWALKRGVLARTKAQGQPPKVVVLWGDGHLDYRQISDNKANLIPPPLSKTGYGLYPNDRIIAEQSVVARIPLRNRQDGQRFLARLKRYLDGSDKRESNKLLLYGAGAIDFESQMELASEGNMSFVLSESENDNPDLFVQSKSEINEALYLGHAGLTDLGESAWLRAEDFSSLEIPIWVGGTCLVNAFSYPGDIESFGENMIRNANTLVSIAPASPKRTDQNLNALIDWNQVGTQGEAVFERFARSQNLMQNMAILGDPLLPTTVLANTENGTDQPTEAQTNAQSAKGGCNSARTTQSLWAFLIVLATMFRKRRRELF